MAARPRHPHKEIEAAVRYAEAKGWTCEMSKGHAWAHLLCPHHDRDGCLIGVWSTPRNREGHARAIMRQVDRCPHGEKPDAEL
jgi:hypothetical protein